MVYSKSRPFFGITCLALCPGLAYSLQLVRLYVRGLLWARQAPRAPLPAQGITSCGVVSCTTSEGVTPPSLLLRAHAPDQIPPTVFGFPYTVGPCRLSPVPAGSWPFPTLSLQSLCRCLDPYPAVFLRCFYSFLPARHRSHIRGDMFDTLNDSCNATSTGDLISGVQSFLYVQAPTLARPPGCTHR